MGFRSLKGPIMILVTIVLVVALFAYILTPTSTPKKVKESDTVTITVLYAVGINSVEITNEKTQQTFTATITTLPYSFNVTRGATVTVQFNTVQNFRYNSLTFDPVGIPFSDNPGTFKADNTNYFGTIVYNNQIILNPSCNKLVYVSPTPSPSPTPIE